MKHKSVSGQLVFMTVAAGALLGLQRPAGATTFTVNETVDAINGNNRCSLREALVAANSNRTTNDCGKGQSGSEAVDKIVLPSGSTFVLSDVLNIKDAVNITTSGTGRVTITPSASSVELTGFTVMPETIRVELHNIDLLAFKNRAITLSASSQAKIFDVTIQGGVVPGVVAQTSSIEVAAGANLQLTRAYVNQNRGIKGGALLASGSVTMGDCTFTNNYSKQYGGGIHVQSTGNVYCKRSNISGNEAGMSGGGVSVGAGGGTFTQNDCVVTGNRAPISPDIHRF